MQEWIAQCRCKKVALKAAGKPIVTSACYCSDCQTAGHRLEQLSDAPRLVSDDGGTAVVLFRKDRIETTIGEELFREYHLTLGSPIRRIVATCCNSPMFLDYTRGSEGTPRWRRAAERRSKP